MRRRPHAIAGLVLVAALGVGCAGNDETPAADVSTSAASEQPTQPTDAEGRNLSSFNGIAVTTGLAVEMTIDPGAEQAVTVQTPQ